MANTKRGYTETGLQRRIRPRIEHNDDSESASLSGRTVPGNVSDTSLLELEVGHLQSADISFGALAEAQSPSITDGRPKKSASVSRQMNDEWESFEAQERKAGKKDVRGFNRASKHAPTELSSKKAVSRKREVVVVTKPEYRDPRFEPSSVTGDEPKTKAAYAFLDEYRTSEMNDLRAAIATTKDDESRDKLKRALMSMESQRNAQLHKAKEQEILDRHKKDEKKLVRQGKSPFYLKRAERKKQVLLERFQGLKGKHLAHTIERRRKKLEAMEKKTLPFTRRIVD